VVSHANQARNALSKEYPEEIRAFADVNGIRLN
jgi:hypothetical protein